MSKLNYVFIALGLVAIAAMAYSTVANQAAQPKLEFSSTHGSIQQRETQASNSNHVDHEAWLRGDDLSDLQRLAPSSQLMPTTEAIALFETRIQNKPTDSRNYVMLGRLNIRYAKESDDFSRFVEAERLFKKAIELGDKKFTAHTYLGRAYLAQHRFKEAAHFARLAYDANANNELALATLGDAAMQLGDYETAKDTFKKLMDRQESASILARMARLKELTGHSDEAKELLERAAALQLASSGNASDEAWYFWRLGEFSFNQGDLASATKHLNRALLASPSDAHSLASLAKVQSALGNFDDAIASYEKSISLLDAPPARLALGRLLESLGRSDQANVQFKAAEEAISEEALDPLAGPAHARERAIYLLKRDKDIQLALELAVNDLKVREDAFAFDVLAWAQYKNGNLADALKSIERSLSSGTKDATLLFHAGMIHSKLNNKDESLRLLQEALELNPFFDLEDAKEAKSVIEQLTSTVAKS